MDRAAYFLILISGTFNISSSSMPRQYYYVNENKTWQEAQSYCRANYIDLATVVSMTEVNNANDCVKKVVPGYGGAAWIGLKRNWGWPTGYPLNNSYAPWGPAQPNEGNTEAACVLYDPSAWSDYFCSFHFYFFCFDDSPTASQRVILVRSSKNWTDAQIYCKQYYTDLAVINNIYDNAAFTVFNTYAWIGLISSQWSDGAFSKFRYWASGNAESTVDDKCTAMVAANSGKWMSTGCNLKMPFICYGGPQPNTRQYHYMAFTKSWLDAQTYCTAKFTDLATIDSYNDLNSLMNQVDIDYSGSLWIGLSRGTKAGWGWSRGDGSLSSYSNWDSGRPNGSGQCGVNINNVWRDYNCTVPLYFVCYYEGNGFIMVNINKTWQDAQSYCRSNYNDLATIRSQWEQKQLIELVGSGVSVWIGLFQDTWEWSDQWGLSFRNWALAQPSSTSGNCTALMTYGSGKWTVQNCNDTLPFVCYGDEEMVNRKRIIKIKMSYSGTANLNDLSTQGVILKQIEKNLIKQNIANVTKLSWRLKNDGNVFVKQRCC